MDGDNLLVDRGRMLQLCEALEKKLPGIEWVATQGMRADLVTEEVLGAMKRAGCISIGFGIESGDDEILALMQKGETSGQIARAISMARNAGFYVVGCFMVGNMGETPRSVDNSIEFMKSLELNDIYINCVIPYPKTVLWEWARENAINFDGERYRFPSTLQPDTVDPAFETKEFPRNERILAFKRFRREAFRSRVRLNLFRRALAGVVLREARTRLSSIACRMMRKDPHLLVLEKCDLWRVDA
jgi:radical SAM superfamily enzyme YgiQ (UPF0313 family)